MVQSLDNQGALIRNERKLRKLCFRDLQKELLCPFFSFWPSPSSSWNILTGGCSRLLRLANVEAHVEFCFGVSVCWFRAPKMTSWPSVMKGSNFLNPTFFKTNARSVYSGSFHIHLSPHKLLIKRQPESMQSPSGERWKESLQVCRQRNREWCLLQGASTHLPLSD